MLGKNFINTITKEKTEEFDNAKIDQNYLKQKISDFNQYFYICGPDAMVEDIHKDLLALGAKEDKIVIEQF
jgi:ferredoxin-NADP reductase